MFCTLPTTVVTMSFCIFIASSTATTSPSLTSSPGLTGTLTMRPCMGASTVPSPTLGAACAALEATVAGAELPATTDRPAPLTRTLKTSPSTSTSNSADAGDAVGAVTATGSGVGGDASGGADVATATGPWPSLFAGSGPRA